VKSWSIVSYSTMDHIKIRTAMNLINLHVSALINIYTGHVVLCISLYYVKLSLS